MNALDVYKWLGEREHVSIVSGAVDVKLIQRLKPRIAISYNYVHIIPAEVIKFMPHRIINMHISLLPWNRGCTPNIWSFWEDTPKGVTIHEMDVGLDTGPINYQKELSFDENKEFLQLPIICFKKVVALF